MKVAYFDCQFGAAGDMLLGSLLGLGLPLDEWQGALAGLALPPGSFRVEVESVRRASLKAARVTVKTSDEKDERGLAEIAEILASSKMDDRARALALRVFTNLARAEAAVHGIAEEKVHFHEVGAIDAIIDIAGFALAYVMLGLEESYVSPLPFSTGTVATRHGLMPLPAPAVVHLLQGAGAPTVRFDAGFESVTPTGAAILATVASGWGPPPAFTRITATGLGAGAGNPPGWPNVVRAIAGDCTGGSAAAFRTEAVEVIEASIDDLSPQTLAYAQSRLFNQGALDVTVTSAVMKKGRSGHILSAVCRPEDAARLQEVILRETSTLGVRRLNATRMVAERREEDVLVDGRRVRLKVASTMGGQIINAHPEYGDLVDFATARGVPLKDAYRLAMQAWRQAGEPDPSGPAGNE